jgi:hypothetical protein
LLTAWVSHPWILQIVHYVIELLVTVVILENDIVSILLRCPQHCSNGVILLLLLLWGAAVAAALWGLLRVRYACGTNGTWLYETWLQCWERLAGQDEVWCCCDHTSNRMEVCVHNGLTVCKSFGENFSNPLVTTSNVF